MAATHTHTHTHTRPFASHPIPPPRALRTSSSCRACRGAGRSLGCPAVLRSAMVGDAARRCCPRRLFGESGCANSPWEQRQKGARGRGDCQRRIARMPLWHHEHIASVPLLSTPWPRNSYHVSDTCYVQHILSPKDFLAGKKKIPITGPRGRRDTHTHTEREKERVQNRTGQTEALHTQMFLSGRGGRGGSLGPSCCGRGKQGSREEQARLEGNSFCLAQGVGKESSGRIAILVYVKEEGREGRGARRSPSRTGQSRRRVVSRGTGSGGRGILVHLGMPIAFLATALGIWGRLLGLDELPGGEDEMEQHPAAGREKAASRYPTSGAAGAMSTWKAVIGGGRTSLGSDGDVSAILPTLESTDQTNTGRKEEMHSRVGGYAGIGRDALLRTRVGNTETSQ
ncbi:hypothetical protein LZ30DRAFT_104527 [Colletotrichum cereale]|nr:hypothetical protein LZ30DRAFT_104527 [Colletotrichum cereale]